LIGLFGNSNISSICTTSSIQDDYVRVQEFAHNNLSRNLMMNKQIALLLRSAAEFYQRPFFCLVHFSRGKNSRNKSMMKSDKPPKKAKRKKEKFPNENKDVQMRRKNGWDRLLPLGNNPSECNNLFAPLNNQATS